MLHSWMQMKVYTCCPCPSCERWNHNGHDTQLTQHWDAGMTWLVEKFQSTTFFSENKSVKFSLTWHSRAGASDKNTSQNNPRSYFTQRNYKHKIHKTTLVVTSHNEIINRRFTKLEVDKTTLVVTSHNDIINTRFTKLEVESIEPYFRDELLRLLPSSHSETSSLCETGHPSYSLGH